MKKLSSNRGFSLIELLTVIAIIAILAGIIFPVMATVKNRARENQCMTQLHQISMAVQMFKQDNRRYPEMICKVVMAGPNPVPMDQAKDDGALFAEYVKSVKVLHCPTSKAIDLTRVVPVPKKPYDQSGEKINVYEYNSYDAFVSGTVAERRYCPDWAGEVGHVDGLEAFDTGRNPQQDFERQLKFRNPPGDTIVTWCSHHEARTASEVRGKSLVVFLDGSAEAVNAAKVEASKWRTVPSKG